MAEHTEQSPGDVVIRELPDPSGQVHRLCEFACPRGHGDCRVPIRDAQIPNGWEMTGDAAAPTLSPSILCHRCGWHGYVRAGTLEDG